MEELKTLRQYISDVHKEVKDHSANDDRSHAELRKELVEVKVNIAKLEAKVESIETGQKEVKDILISLSEKVVEGKINDATIMAKVSGMSLIVGTIVTGAINFLFFGK